jgi:hypothetical protein
MKIQELARRTEVRVLVVFGAVALISYYLYLKKEKDALKWANYTSSM